MAPHEKNFAAGHKSARAFFYGDMLSFLLAAAVTVVPLANGPGGTFTVPVSVGGAPARRFILDLGAGVNVLVPPPIRGPIAGYLTGFRMTGQRMDGALYRVPALELAGIRLPDQPAAYWSGAIDAGVAGYLSAKAFETAPLTLDFTNRTLVLENQASLDLRKHDAYTVPLRVDDIRGESLQLFAEMDLGNGQHGECLIDTGQFNLQINKRYMEALNRPAGGPDVIQQDDRFITHLASVSLMAAPSVRRDHIKAIFRDLIYDCVIGNSFWVQDKSVTLDIAHRMMYVHASAGSRASSM